LELDIWSLLPKQEFWETPLGTIPYTVSDYVKHCLSFNYQLPYHTYYNTNYQVTWHTDDEA
jgi:hypothetical protein